jgi:hypothetical protein
MITVRETTQLGHVVNVVDDPAGSGLLEPFANQVLGRALDHSATDRLAGAESMAVVGCQTPTVWRGCQGGPDAPIRMGHRRRKGGLAMSEKNSRHEDGAKTSEL